jgi:membrane fusion protein (multidrug efflux system)
MKKKIIRITATLLIAGSIVMVLANNKAKIDAAAKPVKEKTVIPVKIHEVKQDSFSAAFSINGTSAPLREVKIASEVQGKLVNLYVSNGDHVRAGQVIAVLDASVHTAQLNSIETSLAKAALDKERFARLIEMGGASSTQLEQAVLQYESLVAQKKDVLQRMEHMQIRAPFSGRIENLAVEKGSYVSFGTILSDLIDNSTLEIKVFLSEKQAFSVKAGEAVKINNAVLAEAVYGRIETISDKADASGKFAAEIHFANKNATLKAGMIADVDFASEEKVPGLSIPVSALAGTAAQGKVFVVNGNKAELRTIRTGIITSDRVQVLEGLYSGEQVVVSGQLNLENGTEITINQ